ncbi:MAG: ribonuclease P protein component [Rugosibacter sp.]
MISSDSSCNFGPDRRLHRPQEFSGVFSSRRSIRGELAGSVGFVLHYRALETSALSRLGIVVPKKLVKRAVDRNAIKRQCREAFRLLGPQPFHYEVVLRVNRILGDIEPSKQLVHKQWRLQINELLNRLTTQ